QAHGRNAASLLAAYRATGDGGLLAEAIQKNSHDPQVALAALLQKEASPEIRRQWLEAFKQADPGNALPYYLSALNHLQAGQLDQAVPELVAASSKPQFRNYSTQRAQSDEEVYLAAGYSEAEARAMAPLQQAMYFEDRNDEQVEATFASFSSQLTLDQQIKDLSVSLKDVAKSYTQAGDPASAEAALQMGMSLGQRYSTLSGENGLSQLVGMAAEVLSLAGMAPNSPYGSGGQTVQERINQLRQQRTAIRGLYQQAVPLLESLSAQDWTSYNERVRFFGEPAALQWVVGNYGQR
ncbi:MAG TPA: hypothetical protein VNZ22_16195, partial [Bacillota bacterium]|nr:hypothetical protein [Bacillota bacterium]